MKNKILLLLLTALAIASCSGDPDTLNSEISNSGLLTLKKVETFYPSAEAYNNSENIDIAFKKVQYFEDGEIVADTMYNKGELYQTTLRATSGTIKTETIYTIIEGEPYTTVITYTYDSSGRITEYKTESVNQESTKTIVYNANGTITVTNQPISASDNFTGVYTVNEQGRISNFDDEYRHLSLIYQDGKPVQYTINYTQEEITDTLNFTYYSNTVPVNRVKTITQVNNIILINGNIYYAAYNAGYYLESHQDYASYIDTFNDKGYLTQSNILEFPDEIGHEIYYYYNE